MAENENAPLKRFFGRHWELFATLASAFVGALALATSTYNVYLQRQQVRAAVWPHVVMDTDFAEGRMSLIVRNRGVGPARLERFRVTVDGKRAEDWVDMLEMLLHKDHLAYFPDTVTLSEEVLTPGMELVILELPAEQDPREVVQQGQGGRLTIAVCYCSTLDDCWELTLREGTKEVSNCAEDPHPFEEMSSKTHQRLLAANASDTPSVDAASAAAAPLSPDAGH